MKELKNYIEEKLVINKSFPAADKYKDDNGNITIENYESFQYWLDENNIEYEVLDQKDKRNNFGHDAKCIINVSFSNSNINKKVALIYTFINNGEFFWSYFIGDDCVYEPGSSSDLYFGDRAFKETLEKRRDPISYIKDMIKTADNKRKKCARKNDYYGRQQMEARIERFNNLITRMTT